MIIQIVIHIKFLQFVIITYYLQFVTVKIYYFLTKCNEMNGIELLETLSANIRFFRKQKMWTQEKLAEETDMSVQAINFFEGKRRWPCEDSLSKIAFALGVEVYQLFVPIDKTPVIIAKTPENEKIRKQITQEVLDEVEHNLKKTLERIKKQKV